MASAAALTPWSAMIARIPGRPGGKTERGLVSRHRPPVRRVTHTHTTSRLWKLPTTNDIAGRRDGLLPGCCVDSTARRRRPSEIHARFRHCGALVAPRAR
eukprot:1375668-Prymnesium_polylepis.2